MGAVNPLQTTSGGVDISFIITSRDRKKELKAFLYSLACNLSDIDRDRNFELIFVDQAGDKTFEGALDNFAQSNKNVTVQKLSAGKISLSKARNIALQEATGRYFAYPDDDCVYPPGMLKTFFQLVRHEKLGVVGVVFDYPNSRLRPLEGKRLNRAQIIGNVISYSFIIENRPARFNENLGVGNFYGAGEETEYLLRALNKNESLLVSTGLKVMHPDQTYMSLVRNRSYGRGFGALGNILIHDKSLQARLSGIRLMVGPFVKILIFLLTGRFSEIRYVMQNLLGRWEGFLMWRKPGHSLEPID